MAVRRIRREEPSPWRLGGGRAASGSASSMMAGRSIRSLSAGRIWKTPLKSAASAGSASISSARSSIRPATAARATATTSIWYGASGGPAVEPGSSRGCGEQNRDLCDLLECAENITRVAADLAACELSHNENEHASEA